MKTLLTIKTDKELKEAAQAVAEGLGLPLSTAINSFLRQMVRDQKVSFSLSEGTLKPSVKRRLDKIHKDIVAGKNLSPVFSDPEDAIRYLNS